jgi:hypothetical protein
MCGEGDDNYVDVEVTDLLHVAGSMKGSSLALSGEVGAYSLDVNMTSENQTMSGSFKAGSGDNFVRGQALMRTRIDGWISQVDASLVDASGTTLFATNGSFEHDEHETFHLSVLDNSFDVRSDVSSRSVALKIGDVEASGAITALEHGGFKVEINKKAGDLTASANMSMSPTQKSFAAEVVSAGEKVFAASAHQNADGIGLSASVMETHVNATVVKRSGDFGFSGSVSSSGENMARIDASCTSGDNKGCSLEATPLTSP